MRESPRPDAAPPAQHHGRHRIPVSKKGWNSSEPQIKSALVPDRDQVSKALVRPVAREPGGARCDWLDKRPPNRSD